MAISILTLMATSFLPILGWKFEWLAIHWMTGLVLTVAVMFHIIRSLFFQKLMNMVPDGKDVASLRWRPARQIQIWHRSFITLAVAVLILCGIGIGPSDAAPHRYAFLEA